MTDINELFEDGKKPGAGKARCVELPLPPYTRTWVSRAKGSAGTVSFRWELPGRLRGIGFEPTDKSLGTDYAAAVAAVENDLKPRLDHFLAERSGRTVMVFPVRANRDAVDGLFNAYRCDPTYLDLRERSKQGYEATMKIASQHVFRSGPEEGQRFGALPISRVTIPVARLLIWEHANAVKVDAVTGLEHHYKRNTQARHLRETMSTIWSAMFGVHDAVTQLNPFAYVRHKRHHVERTYAASVDELAGFICSADSMDNPNIGTAVLCAFESEMRVESILTRFSCDHYKPEDRPREMLISHWKTGVSRWVHLYDDDGIALYPLLEARLDLLKGDRKTGILIPKDGTVDRPWAKPDRPLNNFYGAFRQIADNAGLPKRLTFTSFRHGGITEGAEAGLTEFELQALSMHQDPKTLRKYIADTRTLFENAQRKRLVHRRRVIEAIRRRNGQALDDVDALVVEVLKMLPEIPRPADSEDDED